MANTVRCEEITVPKRIIIDLAHRFNIPCTHYADGVLGFETRDTMKLLVHIALMEKALFK